MTVEFNDLALEKLYKIPMAEFGKNPLSKDVIESFRKKIDTLKLATSLGEIAPLKGLNLEKMKDPRYGGCYSIRVNKQYRILFSVAKTTVLILELTKHYNE